MISRRSLILGVTALSASPAAAFWQSRDVTFNNICPITGACTAAPVGITLVGTSTGTNTATPVAHLAGDIIVFAAFRNTTGTPAVPSGYNSILAKTGTTASLRVGWRTAITTNDAGGTWTNATATVCHVYRPSSGYTLGIGTSASAASTTNTINYPALTFADSFSGNSWALGFVGNSTTTNTIAVAPSGMSNESHETAAATQCAGHDSEGGLTAWASTNATTTGTAGDSVSATVELMLLPIAQQPAHIVQHIGGGSFPASVGSPLSNGNSFKLPFMNSTGTGNCLVLGVTYPNGLTVTVTDNINGTWPAATTHANAGSGNADSAIYVFPNSASGQIVVTVAFSSGVNLFQYSLTEFYQIDATPGAGSSSTAFTAGPVAAAGSFTPTNNDSTGGNIIWAYVAEAQTSPAHITSNIWAHQGFTLLDADIGWINADGLFHASQAGIQATHAAINPTFQMVGDTDQFNTCAIALKINTSQGTAPRTGISLVRVCHFTTDHYPTSGNYLLQSPVVGNLRVVSSDDPNISGSTAITDSEGGTYTSAGAGTGIWYRANTSSNSNLQFAITGGGSDIRLSWRIYDIIGAATSPFDNGLASNQSVNGLSSFTMSPSPTPTTTPGIVVANIGLGQGPGLGITAPSGSVFDLCTYTNETDFDYIEDADLSAHYYYTGTSAQTWTWTITNVATNSTSGGVAIFHS